jgi:hypothetical protein
MPVADRGGIDTDRTLRLDAPADDVWSALGRVGDYRTWWPWLREFDGRVLAAGEAWSCRIAPPLPWSLRITVVLDEVGEGRVDAIVHGDVAGTASVRVDPVGGACELALVASLRAGGGATAVLHRLLPGVSRAAHDRVVDRAFAQFAERALGLSEPRTGRSRGPRRWWRRSGR